jgi:hypothetical protein
MMFAGPELTLSMASLQPMEGRNLFFQCFLRLYQPISAGIQFTWLLNRNVIKGGDTASRIQINNDVSSNGLLFVSILSFSPAKLSDSG